MSPRLLSYATDRMARTFRQGGVCGVGERGLAYLRFQLLRIGAYRGFSDRSECARTHRRLLEECRGGPWKPLADLDLARPKRSDTLFILGSGASVNELTDTEWEHIARHDSVGFNQWMIHDFVPTYYFFEASNGSPEVASERDAFFRSLVSLRASAYADTPFICNYRHWLVKGKTTDDFPREILDRLYLHSPFCFPFSDPKRVARCVRSWAEGADLRSQRLIHHRATLCAAVTFGVLAGYRKFVTVGVDLSHTKYFWEDAAARYANAPTPKNIETGASHATVDASSQFAQRAMPIDEFLYLFDDTVLRPRGLEFYVSSRTSRLHERFPVYPFSERQG